MMMMKEEIRDPEGVGERKLGLNLGWEMRWR